MSFPFINKTFQLNNLKTRTVMNAKISVFVICVEAIVYLLLYNFHDCTFDEIHTFAKWLFTFKKFVHETEKNWTNKCPNLKATCYIKLKFFLWIKLPKNLLLAKYLISVGATLIRLSKEVCRTSYLEHSYFKVRWKKIPNFWFKKRDALSAVNKLYPLRSYEHFHYDRGSLIVLNRSMLAHPS